MSPFWKKIVVHTISFIMIFDNIVFAASSGQNPVQQDRTIEHIRELISGATPSDLPVAGVTRSARDETALLIDKQNLQAHNGKNVFVGYGIYDIEEKNCKYVEKPGLTKTDYLNAFYKRSKFAQHDYGLSRNKMSYADCRALAARLGGHIAVPDTVGEKNFLYSAFVNAYINQQKVKNAWVGIYRQSCSDPNFYNETGILQQYLPFKNDYDKVNCDETKRYLILNEFGRVSYANPNEQHYCMVEFDSKTMFRPIKICAPWWKIIRTYKKENGDLPYDINFLKTINQADIPVEMTVCTKYDQQGIDQINEDNGTARLVQCTTYYSRKKAPECVDKPFQDQCFVDECQGYVENVCELKKEKTLGKGYVKGEIIKDGKLVETKIHLRVKTREYLCPPSPVSNKHCLEMSNVLIYPKECPSSQCQARKECIDNLFGQNMSEEEMNQAIEDCKSRFKCVKIYADRSLPLSPSDIDQTTGEVLQLHGRCPHPDENVILDFPVNKQDTSKKICVEYEEKNVTQIVKQKCVLNRPFEEKVVDMSTTQTDPYENDPNCIREDDIRESQPVTHINVEVHSPGYMQHKARVIHLDKTENTIIDTGSSDFTLEIARYPYLWHGDSYFHFSYRDDQVDYNEQSRRTNRSCDKFAEDKLPNLFQRNIAVLFDGSGDNMTLDPNIGRISRRKVGYDTNDPNNLYAEIKDPNSLGIDSQQKCEQYAVQHGFANWVAETIFYSVNDYTGDGQFAQMGNNACGYRLKSTLQDSMIDAIIPIPASSPAGSVEKIKFVFNSNFTVRQRNGMPDPQACKMAAYCMNGVMENQHPCTITIGGDGSPDSYAEDLGLSDQSQESFHIDEEDVDQLCKPASYSASNGGEFDAIRSIMVFEDYLEGGFGYYSNFNSFPVQSNKVFIHVGNQKYQLPIEKMRTIKDRNHYHLWNDHISYRWKKPNLLWFFIGGSVTGAAYYIGGPWAAAIAAPVVTIIILLFTRPKKMDRQMTENFIYKDIPRTYYSANEYNRYEVRLTPQQDVPQPHQTFSYKLDKGNNAIGNHPDFVRRIYFHSATDTGRDKPGGFRKKLKNILNNKKNMLRCIGYDTSEIERFIHPDERDIHYGYPKCKWYNPFCQKQRHHPTEYTSNTAGLEESIGTTRQYNVTSSVTDKKRIVKEVGTVYLGADNNVMILVPFAGDYRVEAYNKYGDLLASRIVHESSFTKGEEADSLLYAQVNFANTMSLVENQDSPEGQAMNLAPGLTYDLRDHACVQDRMVEWGGGVSGVFYESQRTDESKNCQKSNDAYVFDQSATKLFVQPLNMEDGGFEFNLTKPLPFPNRVWIATLNMKQKRKYICYKDFPQCDSERYHNVEGSAQ